MKKTFAVAVMVSVIMTSAAFAATPVVDSLDGLSAYGTWVNQGTNGRVTKTGTITSADFELAEGLSAQFYVTENKTVAKTGGNRVIPAGAIASVYDERTSAVVPAPAPEIKEYEASQLATSTDVIAAFGGKLGSNGEVISPIPANVKLTVNTTWDHVDFWGGKKTAGETYTSGTTDETATWWPAPAEKEPETPKEIKEYKAEELISAEDVLRVFGNGKKGTNGEVQAEIPAYVKFTVYESWSAVSLWDGTQATPGTTVETGNEAKVVTFWPDYEYWEAKNTVSIVAADIEKYFEVGEPLVEGSIWKTVTAKAETAGKILALGEDLIAVTVKADNTVLETPTIKVAAADAETAADAADVIRICKKADLEVADYATLAGIRKASPVEVETENKGEGSNAVKFYVALNSWKPVLGGNLFDLSVDETHVEKKDGLYSSKDGYAIGFVTAWLHNVVDATRKAADTGNGGGGGGGGCDAGFGVLALALLPFFYLKKGRK